MGIGPVGGKGTASQSSASKNRLQSGSPSQQQDGTPGSEAKSRNPNGKMTEEDMRQNPSQNQLQQQARNSASIDEDGAEDESSK